MDSKAVSALIGFVLMLAIIMGFIGIMQSKFVPEWNKDVEAKHLDKLSYEVADLSEAVSLAASTGNPAKVVLDAGVEYPEYYVLVSPSKAATAIFSEKLSVIVDGKAYETSAIVVEPQYLYLSHPKFVFEHSAVFRLENSNLVVDSEQSSFTERKITIYLINTTFDSLTSTENLNIVLYPVSYGGSTHYGSLTITLESYNDKTAEWWENTLSSLGFSVSRTGRNVTITATNVDLSIEYFIAYATTAGSVSANPSIGSLRILNLSEQSYSVYRGTTIPLGVRVVDEFNNPARSMAVSVADSCHGTTTKTTNDDGEVWYYFSADNSGTCEVRFSVSGDSFTYDIRVSSVSSGGGIFNVSWNVPKYNWNVSLVGPQKAFKVSVLYGTSPVKGAVVDISTDAPNLVSYPESVTTDQNGESVVTVTALENGTAHLFATAGGSGSILELIISGAGGGGFCPAGWGYWREITIKNNVDENLIDYQIKIVIDTQSLISTGKMKSDCGDIRFYDESWGSTLSYWIEDGTCDTANTVIWVKVPNIPASGTVKIYMVYGNSSASSESDIDSTFYDGTLYYTRYSTADPDSLNDGINAFESASDQSGYCEKFITDFNNVANSNSNGCSGSYQNIAFWVEAYFYVDRDGLWSFRYGPDFGRGGGLYIDSEHIEEGWTDDLWWGYSWSNPDVLSGSKRLNVGWHKLFVLGFEGCCDGGQMLEFCKGRLCLLGWGWKDWSTTNLEIKSRKLVFPEPTVDVKDEETC